MRRCLYCEREHDRKGAAVYCIDCMRLTGRLRSRAHSAVHHAIAAGKLSPPNTKPCADCGVRADCYDHRDYRKPLEVDAVCWSCNHKRGPGQYERAA